MGGFLKYIHLEYSFGKTISDLKNNKIHFNNITELNWEIGTTESGVALTELKPTNVSELN